MTHKTEFQPELMYVVRIFSLPHLAATFAFTKLQKTHHWPSLPQYTSQDVEREVSRLATLPIHKDVLFRHVWERRIRANLINFEEGVCQQWHSGRIALVGDAVHKVRI